MRGAVARRRRRRLRRGIRRRRWRSAASAGAHPFFRGHCVPALQKKPPPQDPCELPVRPTGRAGAALAAALAPPSSSRTPRSRRRVGVLDQSGRGLPSLWETRHGRVVEQAAMPGPREGRRGRPRERPRARPHAACAQPLPAPSAPPHGARLAALRDAREPRHVHLRHRHDAAILPRRRDRRRRPSRVRRRLRNRPHQPCQDRGGAVEAAARRTRSISGSRCVHPLLGPAPAPSGWSTTARPSSGRGTSARRRAGHTSTRRCARRVAYTIAGPSTDITCYTMCPRTAPLLCAPYLGVRKAPKDLQVDTECPPVPMGYLGYLLSWCCVLTATSLPVRHYVPNLLLTSFQNCVRSKVPTIL